MDQQHHRLRLVPGGQPARETRSSPRRALRVPGQLVWKDAHGTTKVARILTRDVSDVGVAVECLDGGSIPLFRLVYIQIDRAVREHSRELPQPLRRPVVLSAIYRVGPTSQATGLPESYALRLLVEPERLPRSARRPASEVRHSYERSA